MMLHSTGENGGNGGEGGRGWEKRDGEVKKGRARGTILPRK
jgi:hypothetical protein